MTSDGFQAAESGSLSVMLGFSNLASLLLVVCYGFPIYLSNLSCLNVCACAWRAESYIRSLGAGVKDSCDPNVDAGIQTPIIMTEQQLLSTTEPSLQIPLL